MTRYQILDAKFKCLQEATNNACYASICEDVSLARTRGKVKYVRDFPYNFRECKDYKLWITRFMGWFDTSQKVLESPAEIDKLGYITIDAAKHTAFEVFLVFNMFRYMTEHSKWTMALQQHIKHEQIPEKQVFDFFVKQSAYVSGYGLTGNSNHGIYCKGYGFTARDVVGKVFIPKLDRWPDQPMMVKSDGHGGHAASNGYKQGIKEGFSSYMNNNTTLIKESEL